ncbi:MAG: hypothetical protein KAQ69_05385 [Spirochaetales bacterium]|nr:hypothetical protein [Spirochaetales bacterium]
MNKEMLSAKKIYNLIFSSLSLIFIVMSIFGCRQESTITSETTTKTTIQLLWNEKDYEKIYSSIDYNENLLDISKNNLLFYGFSAYYLFRETGSVDYLNQTLSSLERFRLLYSESSDINLLNEVHLILSLSNYLLGQYKNAILHAEKVISLGTVIKKDIHIILGLSYYFSGDFAKSLIELSEIENPSYQLTILLYRISKKINLHAETIEYLNAASSISDNELEKYISNILLVNDYNSDKQYDSALNILNSLKSQLSSPFLLSSLYYYLGIIHGEKGNYIEARTMWNRSLEHNSENTYALDKLSK